MNKNNLNTIIHVIVTYKNYSDTVRLLSSIQNQTTSIQPIVIIDNTETSQHNFKYLSKILMDSPHIHYVKTTKNIGSAGGFGLGMQLGYELGAEYLWLHDQDGFPLPHCLEALLTHLDSSSCDILSPYLVDENYHYLSALHGTYDKYWNLRDLLIHSDVTLTDVAASAGLLIHRNVIEAIGIYDYEHFFNGYEDFDFCLRAKKAGFKTGVVRKAMYYHPNKWRNFKRTSTARFLTFYGEINSTHDIRMLQQSHIYYFVFHNSNHPFLSLFFTVTRYILQLVQSRHTFLFWKSLRTLIRAYLAKTKLRKYFLTKEQIQSLIFSNFKPKVYA